MGRAVSFGFVMGFSPHRKFSLFIQISRSPGSVAQWIVHWTSIYTNKEMHKSFVMFPLKWD